MTIKELYRLAEMYGKENAKIFIDYECNDDWYSVQEYLKREQIIFNEKENIVEIRL